MKKITEHKRRKEFFDLLKIIFGCALFSIGFNLFLEPAELNPGGISGVSMVVVYATKLGTVGLVSFLLNIPLFIIAGLKIGKKFFWGSLIGMFFTSLFIDLFSFLPQLQLEPLISALYGGVICGFGIGCVFSTGVSTGGSDIVVRLLKKLWPSMPIGVITFGFDLCVVALNGLVFQNLEAALYSGVAIFVIGQIIDVVVYRFDYSKVALIITKEHEAVAQAISEKLDRGATYLYGEGAYKNRATKVVLTAVRKQQLADLKELVVELDPNAFIIVQEAHQVLGDGFSRYSKDAL